MTIAEQLRAEGEARGIAKGRSQGKADSVLLVLEARGLHVSDANRHRIETCHDLDQLGHWLVRAATVTTVEDIFED